MSVFFEIGKVFRDRNREELMLGILLTGYSRSDWLHKEQASLFELKGIVNNLFERFNVHGVGFSDSDQSGHLFEIAAALTKSGQRFGVLAEIASKERAKWDLESRVFVAEISLDTLFKHAQHPGRYQSVPSFPSVRRDIAIVVDEAIESDRIVSAIIRSASPFVSSAQLFDEFKGKGIPSGKRSLAISIEYLKKDGTFTDDEINKLQHRISEVLKNNYDAKFR